MKHKVETEINGIEVVLIATDRESQREALAEAKVIGGQRLIFSKMGGDFSDAESLKANFNHLVTKFSEDVDWNNISAIIEVQPGEADLMEF